MTGFCTKCRALLESGENIFLITHRRDHDDARFAMLVDDALDGLDAFHLRHGDVHEHDIRLGAIKLRDGGESVAGFSRDFAAEISIILMMFLRAKTESSTTR